MARHVFMEMEPEWYETNDGERVNANALAPLVCTRCKLFDIEVSNPDRCGAFRSPQRTFRRAMKPRWQERDRQARVK